jgi:hypothetical protein
MATESHACSDFDIDDVRPAGARGCTRLESPRDTCGWRIVTGEPILPVIALRK